VPGFRQSTGFARGPGFASDYSPPTWGFRRPSSVTPAIANNAALSVGSVGSVGPITTVTAVVPAAVGDLLVLGIRLGNATATVLTVTGGGVTTWTVNATVADVTPGISTCICYGVVTSVASSSLVITTSATVNTSIALLEFSKTAGTWAADGPQGSAADAGTFPTLVPSASAEMYIGFIAAGTSAITASSATAGYTQVNSGFSAMIYNVSVTGPQTPSVTATNHTGAVAQLIAA
jgi:hypothetical protein